MSETEGPTTIAAGEIRGRRIHTVRQAARQVAEETGLDADATGRLVIAVSEAATNTVRHAADTGRFEIIQDDHRKVIAEVSDQGPGFDTSTPGADQPAPAAESGRGLWLIRRLADRFHLWSTPRGTTVRIEMDAPTAGQQPATTDPAAATAHTAREAVPPEAADA